MHDPWYGLIVEGTYDEAVLPEFVRRIAEGTCHVEARPCNGIVNLKKNLPGFLSALQYAKYGAPVDKALVIRDAAGSRPTNDLIVELQTKIHGRNFSFPKGIGFCVIRQEMETWLLADIDAINHLGKRHVAEVKGQLEDILDPKRKLTELLKHTGLPFDAEVCRTIAENTNLERLRSRCPSFREFEAEVLSALED